MVHIEQLEEDNVKDDGAAIIRRVFGIDKKKVEPIANAPILEVEVRPTVDTPIFAGETFSFPEGDDPKKFQKFLGFDPHEHRRRSRENRFFTEPYANANFLLFAPEA